MFCQGITEYAQIKLSVRKKASYQIFYFSIHLCSNVLYSIHKLLQEEESCGHRRQVQQQEVQELTQEQIRGRQEAAGDRGQTELSQEQISWQTQTQGRAPPVRCPHSRGGGKGGSDPGLATWPELPVRQPRRGAGHVQPQQIRDPDPGFWR